MNDVPSPPAPDSAALPGPLDPSVLRQVCDPAWLPFETTAELPEFDGIVGQDRATEAVEFGVELRRDGYNLFVLGPPGIGKRTVVQRMLRRSSAAAPVPADWCYVNNFDDPRRPRAVSLPAGRGVRFRNDVKQLVVDLSNAVRTALERDEHKNRQKEIEQEATEHQEGAFRELARKALGQKIQLIRTPGGFAFAPTRNGEVMNAEEFEKLEEAERERIKASIQSLQNELRELIEGMPARFKEAHDKIRQLNRDAVKLAIGHLFAEARRNYAELPEVSGYFDAAEKDILERVDEFQPSEEPAAPSPLLAAAESKPSFEDYEVNLFVDNSQTVGAPIVTEDHPSYHNLIGRVEHESQMGALFTDFTLIKAGALHRANGGYLVLDAWRLLQQPFAWDALKRALAARSVKIESLGEVLSLISTVSLEPAPIPLDVKVVLLGDRLLYYLLYAYDPDFAEQFKVAADFEDDIPRTPESSLLFARFLGTLARRDGLRPLRRDAIARLLEQSSRTAEDAERLSTHLQTLTDLLTEADYWAGKEEAATVEARHVQQAIDVKLRRSDRVRQRIHEEIRRGTILIEVDGARTGQVNGLSVLELGDFRFGQPSRITAATRLGRGEVIDIEREVKLAGPTHSKGVLILSSYLAHRYARERPLSLSVSLAFEQSYGLIDGDSASTAELCAILSSLAEAPILQSWAVTGSVDQFGRVQPIGGVNDKIEGFFDVCRARGLTGRQGVLIPDTNVKHLMLRPDVVEAVREGRFQVRAVSTVDQAFSLLTGLPAGVPDARGEYPEGTLNRKVVDRLQQFLRLRNRFGAEASSGPPRRSLGEEPGHE